MNVIGIHDGHNATVALLQDNDVTYALSEERLSRVKNQGGFPHRALSRILDNAHLAPGAIHRIIFTTNNTHVGEWHDRQKLLKRYHETALATQEAALIRPLLHRVRTLFGSRSRIVSPKNMYGRYEPLMAMGFHHDQIGTMDHHLAHAASGYYSAHQFDQPVLCLTNDGGGDGLCGTVSIGRAGRLERLAEISVRNSFAALYARATFFMGMMPLEHEYKLMGLAPYADQRKAEELADVIFSYFEWPEDAPLTWRLKPRFATVNWVAAEFRHLFQFVRFDLIAAAMQIFVEKMTIMWIERCIRETKIPRLILAGGLFMNVKMNKRILELPGVESVFVMPSSGDESTPFGACYLGAVQSGESPQHLQPLQDLYLGPSYDRHDIDTAVRQVSGMSTLRIEEPPSMASAIATLLTEDQIVAVWQGREEFGARALGNRSIIANPSNLKVIRELNATIKSRDFWMPFAGTMTEEQAHHTLRNPKKANAPYMMMTFDLDGYASDCAAAIHPYDQTMRPQILPRAWNPAYHEIIQEFEKKSGKRAGVLNTSFNLHGYPIVSSPQDAVDVFLKSGLRYLALGSYLLKKSS